MLIEADATGLEVVAAAFLSQDRVLCGEIRDKVDIHAVNQRRFGFDRVIADPDESRRVAKIFKFRLIYGGTKWSYALDPDFNWINDTPDYWQGIIDEYYSKYQGVAEWHRLIYEQAIRDGRLVMPTRRVYTYKPYFKKDRWTWPRTTILNYPVQGLGADLMAIARVSARRRLYDIQDCLFINTVHDSIILDTKAELCDNICRTLDQVFQDVPKNFERMFGIEFNLPMSAKIKYGLNWKDMKEWHDN